MQKNGCEKLSKAMLFNLETCTMNIKWLRVQSGGMGTIAPITLMERTLLLDQSHFHQCTH